jgi:hypothetical protein
MTAFLPKPLRLACVCGLVAMLATSAAFAAPDAWDVTVAVRISETGDKPVEVHVALPADDDRQTISDVDVRPRGLKSDIVRGAEPEVVFRGRVTDSRRVSVTFRVDRTRLRVDVPAVQPAADPPLETLEALRPAPLYPSRSILVREFLETHVAPKLRAGENDMLRAIVAAIREQLPYDKTGKSLPLDVLRRGHGLRIGRERVLTASLRSAGIPARFVEGVALSSSTRRKRRFWNEVWHEGRWYPVSVSGGWIGKLPDDYVAVVSDGRRVVRSLGAGIIEYSVVAHPAPERPAAKTPGPGEKADDEAKGS